MESKKSLGCFSVRGLFPLYTEIGTSKVEVDEHLSHCKECKKYYEKLQKARLQLTSLSQTKVSQGMIDYLKQEHFFWSDFNKKLGWKKWPATLKWAIELSTVTVILILIIHYIPWIGVARTVQRMRPHPPSIMVAVGTPIPENPQIPTPSATMPPETVAKAEVKAPIPTTPVPTPKSTVTPKPTPTAEEVTKNDEETTEDEEENSQTAGVLTKESELKNSGFVWRGSLKVDELSDDVAERVTKSITDLGGTKAGQVELGWHRGKQRYYHFILPEENYEKLLSVLNSEGIVQLIKERHPRTIKEGHMRIIMTIEESGE